MTQFEASISKIEPAGPGNQSEQSWHSRALDSFLQTGKEAIIDHPVNTTLNAAAGFAIGRGVQHALIAAESVGGKVGVAARVAEVAFGVAPFVYMAHHIYTADDSAKEAGKVIFDAGLLMAASNVGRAFQLSTIEQAALASGKVIRPGYSTGDAPFAKNISAFESTFGRGGTTPIMRTFGQDATSDAGIAAANAARRSPTIFNSKGP
ncbi:hypothetical protein BH10CYA1_BH10CYA1_23770 [soil metagenome]